MSRFPETRALAEQAFRHVLDEQAKLLKRTDCKDLVEILAALNGLAIKTSKLLVDGFNSSPPLKKFTEEAIAIEKLIDDTSESLWTAIRVSISAIYQKMELSVKRPEGEWGLAAETRAHYHNLRIRLLEQLLGTRMLAMNSDLGEETERIWIQFLEKQLGPSLRVLRGGKIYDHQGNHSSQIDLIVVGADAQVFLPGDTGDGKAHVLIDQVVAAIMVTSNLTAGKLKKDWENLQSVPTYGEMEEDYSFLKGHPWPLCYIVGTQSDPIEKLESAWQDMCRAGHKKAIPQFVITLDAGFLYGGWRRWPCPRYPGNYTEAEDVSSQTGIYAGLGLGWLILQLQGRIAAIRRHVLQPISKHAKLLDKATMREGVPPTWSPRFDRMWVRCKIGGIFEWGGCSFHAHNRLQLVCLSRMWEGATSRFETEIYVDGTDIEALKSLRRIGSNFDYLRWFRPESVLTRGRILAVEEWTNARSRDGHSRKIAVFDTITGDEVKCGFVDSLSDFPDIELLEKEVTPHLRPAPEVRPATPA